MKRWPRSLFSALLLGCAFFPALEGSEHGIDASQLPFHEYLLQNNPPATLFSDTPVEEDRITLNIADVMMLTLQVDVPATQELLPLDPITKSPGWRLVEASAPALTPLEHGTRRFRRSWTLEPTAVGDFSLIIEPLRITEKSGAVRTLAWKPVRLHVHSQIANPDLKGLRDPTFIEPLPEVPAHADSWFTAGAGVAVLASAAVIYLLLRRRKRGTPLTAQQRAIRRLQRLASLKLPLKEKIPQYHALLAAVLRSFLEKRFSLAARRRTTQEFLREMQSSSQLDTRQQEFVRLFLEKCDLVKFAKAGASVSASAVLAHEVEAFITNIGEPRK